MRIAGLGLGHTRVVVLVTTLLLACSLQTVPAVGLPTQAEVAATVARQTEALAKGDRAGFDATYDDSRLALRRWLTDRFDKVQRGYPFPRDQRVLRVEPYGLGYVRAYIETWAEQFGVDVPLSHALRYYFRRLGDRVVFTEPLENEVGAEHKEQVDEHFTLDYFGIDDDVATLVVSEIKLAEGQAVRLAQRGFTSNVLVQLGPTRQALGPGWGDYTSAFYGASVKFAPNAIANDSSLRALSNPSRYLLRFEVAHSLQEQIAPGIQSRVSLDARWLTYGWVSFATGIPLRPEFFRSACSGVPPPTLKQLGEFNITDDWARLAPTAESMISFMYERFGVDGYWRLLSAFRDSAESRVTFPKALGQTADAFYADWLVWAKKKYC